MNMESQISGERLKLERHLAKARDKHGSHEEARNASQAGSIISVTGTDIEGEIFIFKATSGDACPAEKMFAWRRMCSDYSCTTG